MNCIPHSLARGSVGKSKQWTESTRARFVLYFYTRIVGRQVTNRKPVTNMFSWTVKCTKDEQGLPQLFVPQIKRKVYRLRLIVSHFLCYCTGINLEVAQIQPETSEFRGPVRIA